MSADTMMSVGIIGVGALGMGITERLVAAGHDVHGFRRGSLDEFTAIGGHAAATAAAVVASVGPIILLVPDETGLLAVMEEIAPSLHRGQILLCFASHPVAVKQAAAAIAATVGATLLDGEISGTPIMVREGRGVVLIAGEAEAIDALTSVLDAIAARTTRLNAFGDAYRMKLVANYLVGVHTLAAAEALVLAERLGLDLPLTVKALVPSAAGSKMLEVRGPMMAAHSYPSGHIRGFLGYHDMLRTALTERGEAAGPLLELTERLYLQAIEDGYGDSDIGAVHESLAGRRPKLV
jgi:3-hydroxyisobutyrate dehydrogenase-like beta-hydroxyacid dehydrogenase